MDKTSSSIVAENLANLLPVFRSKILSHLHFGIPANHFYTLVKLCDDGTQTVSELAAKLLISKQQMSPIIDKLFKLGYIDREKNPHDRRNINVSITPKGFEVLVGHQEKLIALLDKKCLSLSSSELEEMHGTLQSFFKLFNRLP